MVFLSFAVLGRKLKFRGFNKGPEEFYKKRNIFRLSAHFFGRVRNCYSIALKKVHRSLVYSTKGRKLKREDMRDLWTTRVTAGCEELGLPFMMFRNGLQSSDVLLNRKSLADLAIWEPRTFKALTDFSRTRAVEEGFNGIEKLNSEHPSHVVTRGMLKKKS